jgi:hypothetical protein
MTDETVEQSAIRAISDITKMHIEHVVLKVDRIIHTLDAVYADVDSLKQVIHQQRQEIKQLAEAVKQLSNLLPNETVDALTRPLIGLQTESKRRREISNLHRQREAP